MSGMPEGIQALDHNAIDGLGQIDVQASQAQAEAPGFLSRITPNRLLATILASTVAVGAFGGIANPSGDVARAASTNLAQSHDGFSDAGNGLIDGTTQTTATATPANKTTQPKNHDPSKAPSKKDSKSTPGSYSNDMLRFANDMHMSVGQLTKILTAGKTAIDSSGSSANKPASPAASPSSANTSGSSSQLQRAENDQTVAETVKDMPLTRANFKSNISDIIQGNKKQLDHGKGSMSSLRSEYGTSILGRYHYGEAIAASSVGSTAFGGKVYNELHGNHTSSELPEGVTPEQANSYIGHILTDPGTRLSVSYPPQGAFENHGQRGEDIFPAGIVNLDGSEAVFTVTTHDGTTVYFKVFDNNCLNILDVVQEVPQTITTTETVVTHEQMPAPHQHHGRHHQHMHRVHKRKQHPKPHTPHQPPTGGTPPHQQIKVAVPLPAGKNHADQSPGTPSTQEATLPVAGVGPNATTVAATTVAAAAATYSETGGTPAPGEPAAPVVEGAPTSAPTATTPDQGESTQSNGNGGFQGQGGSVSPDSAPVGASAGSSS